MRYYVITNIAVEAKNKREAEVKVIDMLDPIFNDFIIADVDEAPEQMELPLGQA